MRAVCGDFFFFFGINNFDLTNIADVNVTVSKSNNHVQAFESLFSVSESQFGQCGFPQLPTQLHSNRVRWHHE